MVGEELQGGPAHPILLFQEFPKGWFWPSSQVLFQLQALAACRGSQEQEKLGSCSFSCFCSC